MKDDVSTQHRTELLICTKCRRADDADEDATRPGKRLFEALVTSEIPEGVTVTGVECLQNCDNGCTVALRGGPDRWTYIYGNVDETSQLDTILQGAALYNATEDGLIPWRQRPDHFKKNCIARIPPLEAPK